MKLQKKEVEPTFSIQHPEDEATNEDLNKLVELSETSDNETVRMPESGQACEKETNAEPKEVVPDYSDITENRKRELKVKEDQYECKDCKLKSENKNNLRHHVCNTQKKLKFITDHEANRQSNDNKEYAKLTVDDEMKGALFAKEDEKDKKPENLIVINTDEEKKLNDNTIPDRCPICDQEEKDNALMQLHKENTHADQKRLSYEERISQFISENQIKNSCKDINNLKTHLKIEYKEDRICWDFILSLIHI